MGAWGTGGFENDAAADWAQECARHCAETGDCSFIDATLDQVLAAEDDELDAADAEEGRAAAEAVARMQGNRGEPDGYSQALDDWIAQVRPVAAEALAAKARAAITRILTEPSELRDLWADSDDFADWRAAMLALRARIA